MCNLPSASTEPPISPWNTYPLSSNLTDGVNPRMSHTLYIAWLYKRLSHYYFCCWVEKKCTRSPSMLFLPPFLSHVSSAVWLLCCFVVSLEVTRKMLWLAESGRTWTFESEGYSKIGRCLMLGWSNRFLSFRRLASAWNALGFLSWDFTQGHLAVLGFHRLLRSGTSPNRLFISS